MDISSLKEWMGIQLVKDFPIYKQNGWSGEQVGEVPYFYLTLVFTIAVFIMEFFLDIRQLIRFQTSKAVPKELKGFIPEEKFFKSLSYGTDKFSFGLIEGTFMFGEGIALMLLGYLPYLWDLAEQKSIQFGLSAIPRNPSSLLQEMAVTSIFVALLMLHDTLISLPFSLYKTFVVEEKHGFNKSTLGLFIRDKLLTIALSLGLGAPIISVIVWLVRVGGPYFYFYVWAFLFVVSLVMMTIYPTFIAPLFNKYEKLESGPVYEAVEKLAKQVSFPLTQLFVVDGSRRSAHSNAYFYGFFKNKRIVLFDTLIKQVELPELLAILGHEIGHWRLWHTIQGFVVTQAYVFCLFLSFSYVQNTPGLFASFGFSYSASAGVPVIIGLVLFSQTFWSPVDKALTLILNFNSRANEFAADKYANDLGMGPALSTGLIKISIENLGNMVPDPLYSAYHFSHPPLVERLRAMETNKSKSQ